MQNFGLWDYFELGAFGDDHEDRNKLIPFATQRFREKYDGELHEQNVWIIGDTPRDVECARPHGALAIAVATGQYDRETLARSEPDFLFDDFSDPSEFLKLVRDR